MLSQTVEYALRAIVYLANEIPRPQTVEQIADRTLVPPAYLSKVLQNLGRGGIVSSQRGVKGGFQLLIPPDKLTVLQVVNSVDPLQRIKECPLGLSTHGSNLCPLHRRLDDALAELERAFTGTTIAEILSEPGRSVPLCESPEKKLHSLKTR